jgi:hypothetical protein
MAGSQAASAFPINLEGNAAEKSKEYASELEKLRQRIEGSTSSLKGMESAMKRLQAASVVDVAAARDLKTKIQEQKDTIAAASTQVLKLGTTYDQLADKAKRATKGSEDLAKKTQSLDGAVRGASPNMAELSDKFSGLFDLLGSGASVLELAGVGVLAIAAAAVAAAAALGAFAVASAVALAKFVVESQNAARAANLLRLAFVGTDQNAANLGTQVDALARKVPTAKGELNKLATELAEAGFQGQTLVDTFNAMGQASSAGGDKAAAKIREVLDRGKLSGRTGLNAQELMGSGLKFDEVATALAEQMNIGVGKARMALLQGAVPLGDAAAAMRKAVETKFGAINASKMLDLGTQIEKFKEGLAGLAKDVKIEPLLQDLSQLFGLFSSSSSVTGGALKQLVTAFGSSFVDGVHEATPVAKAFIEGLVLGALKLYGMWLDLRIAVRDAFANNETLKKAQELAGKIDTLGTVGKVAAGAMMALGIALGFVAVSLALVMAALLAIPVAIGLAGYSSVKGAKSFDKLGSSIVDGILSPLRSAEGIDGAVTSFVDKLKGKLQTKLEMHSPSALMRDEVGHDTGRGIVVGTVEGLEDGVPEIARALDNMVSPPAGKGGAAGSANDNAGAHARPLEIHVHIGTPEAAKAFHEPSTYAQFLKVIEEALISAGIPVRQ